MMRSLRTALAATVLAVTAAAMAQEAAPDTADCTFHQGTTTCFGEIVYPTEPFTESVPAGYVYCGGNGIMYQSLVPSIFNVPVEYHYFRNVTVYRGQSDVVAEEYSLLV